MKQSEETSADDILTSLSGVLGSSDGAIAGIDPLEELVQGETLESNSEIVLVDEDEHRPQSAVSNTKKRKHTSISDDPWSSGFEQLSEKDVVYDRGEVVRRMRKKIRIRKCILCGIGEMLSKDSVVDVGSELGLFNPCQKYTRSRPNNLNLK